MKTTYSKIRKILKCPSEFFEKTKKENQKQSNNFLKKLSSMPAIFAGLITMFGFMSISSMFGIFASIYVTLIMGVFTIIYVYVLFVLGIYLTAIIFHPFIRFFNCEGTLKDTTRIIIYANTPSYLFGALMFVPLKIISYSVMVLIIIYSTYLTIIGVSKQHNLSIKKSAISILIPTAILLVATIYLII